MSMIPPKHKKDKESSEEPSLKKRTNKKKRPIADSQDTVNDKVVTMKPAAADTMKSKSASSNQSEKTSITQSKFKQQ